MSASLGTLTVIAVSPGKQKILPRTRKLRSLPHVTSSWVSGSARQM